MARASSRSCPETFTIDGILLQDIASDPAVQWLYRNGSDVLRIIGGAIDVGIGAATALGSGGLAILPSAGLMAVGIDQIITGVTNISTGTHGPSLFEFGGYSAARGLGAGEGTSQVIGALTPMALSLGMAGWAGAMERGQAVVFHSVGGGVPGPGTGGWGFGNWFKFWRDKGGVAQFEATGNIPFMRQYRVSRYLNRDLAGTPGFLDTAAHEGVHIFMGRWLPGVVDAGRIPLIGGPINYVHELIAYSIGHLAAGRVHALPLVPLNALRSLTWGDRAEVAFWGYVVYRVYRQQE